MNRCALHPLPQRSRAGFTLVEALVAVALGMLVLAVVAALSLYGSKSFVAMGNYADLDQKSRNALDVITREIRQSSRLVAFQTNLPAMSLTLTNANQGATVKVTWYSDMGALVLEKTGQPAQTNLTGCDRWSFVLYQRTPLVTPTNIVFYPATNSSGVLDPSVCKLIDMSWKCSRTILGQKLNSESVQSAQIVLRNKQ